MHHDLGLLLRDNLRSSGLSIPVRNEQLPAVALAVDLLEQSREGLTLGVGLALAFDGGRDGAHGHGRCRVGAIAAASVGRVASGANGHAVLEVHVVVRAAHVAVGMPGRLSAICTRR